MSMRHVRPLLLALSALALLAVACDRGGKPEVSATATSSPTPVASASPTPGTSPAPLPDRVEVASTVQLIDVRTGVARTLFENRAPVAHGATFVDGEIVISVSNAPPLRFRLDGSTVTNPSTPLGCREANGAAEIGGRSYSGVRCGSISPDRRWMIYEIQTGEVEVGTSGYRVAQRDMWSVDLQSGATRQMQTGLVDCGGCDGRYAPRWSTNSRYVAYAEFGGTKRRFLSDLSNGATRQIGSGNEVNDAPEWAPTGDLLVYSTTANGTVARFEELVAGTWRDLEVPWPVRFGAGGAYLYSPAWGAGPEAAPATTTIVEAASGRTLATLAGAPPPAFLWTRDVAVTRFGGGYIAVLQRSGECTGTAIYREGVALPRCIADGILGQVAPDGSHVAVARETGRTGPVGPRSMPQFDIDIIDVATGASRTVVTGATSFSPPLMEWNAAGTHLLMLWPYSSSGL